MGAVIIIGIIIFAIWLINANNSSSSSSTTTYRPTESYKPVITKTVTPATPPKIISVSPKTITTNPDLKLSLIDGELRTFQNYYIDGVQYTFGFPKKNCSDKRVWIGIEKKEVERISYQEAITRINNKSIGTSNQLNTSIDVDDDLPF